LPIASSRSFWLTAFFSASGSMRLRLASAVTSRASSCANWAFATCSCASKGLRSSWKSGCPSLTIDPSRYSRFSRKPLTRARIST